MKVLKGALDCLKEKSVGGMRVELWRNQKHHLWKAKLTIKRSQTIPENTSCLNFLGVQRCTSRQISSATLHSMNTWKSLKQFKEIEEKPEKKVGSKKARHKKVRRLQNKKVRKGRRVLGYNTRGGVLGGEGFEGGKASGSAQVPSALFRDGHRYRRVPSYTVPTVHNTLPHCVHCIPSAMQMRQYVRAFLGFFVRDFLGSWAPQLLELPSRAPPPTGPPPRKSQEFATFR